MGSPKREIWLCLASKQRREALHACSLRMLLRLPNKPLQIHKDHWLISTDKLGYARAVSAPIRLYLCIYVYKYSDPAGTRDYSV